MIEQEKLEKALEEWRPMPVVGMENRYQVSSFGRIRTTLTGMIRKCPKNAKNGYPYVVLFREDGTCFAGTVHSLVLKAFVGPRPKGYQARHMDGSRDNNHLNNLRWGTAKENRADTTAHGRLGFGEQAPKHVLTEEQAIAIRRSPLRHYLIAKQFGIHKTHVRDIRTGKKWPHLKHIKTACRWGHRGHDRSPE